MRLLILLLFCTVIKVHAQNAMGGAMGGGAQTKGIDMNAQPFGTITEIKADTKTIKGNTYLYDQWFPGTITFINDTQLKDRLLRYNIQSDIIEIRSDNEDRVVESRFVKHFDMHNPVTQQNEKYVNASDFKSNTGVQFLGFFKELQSGSITLYSKTDVKLVKSGYVQALDMGDEDDRYKKETKYYVLKKSSLIEISLNKKKFAALFPEHENKILEYIKDHRLALKSESDLATLVSFVNTLNG